MSDKDKRDTILCMILFLKQIDMYDKNELLVAMLICHSGAATGKWGRYL